MLYANTVSSFLSSSLEVVVKLRRALASAFKRSADGYPLDIAYGPDRGWWLRRRFLNRAGESTYLTLNDLLNTYRQPINASSPLRSGSAQVSSKYSV